MTTMIIQYSEVQRSSYHKNAILPPVYSTRLWYKSGQYLFRMV